ncbi:hypothetical protein AB7M49_007144 [Bradyrhizobium elkanii]
MQYSLRRMLAGAAFALIGCVAASIPAFAERRVALVIGNSAYRNTVQLPNPRNDATDVARMSRSCARPSNSGWRGPACSSAHPTAATGRIRSRHCKARRWRNSSRMLRHYS